MEMEFCMAKSQYDSVAKEYEKIRPQYPQELIDTLISVTGINLKSRLLEIGAGTGKATMPLARKGYKINCIEIEPKMAEILKNKCNDSDVAVIIDDFETWKNRKEDTYDLIYSAQAFHWIDERIKYKKCHSLLNNNGQIGVFWYFSVIECQESLKMLNSIFKKYNTGFACSGIDGCRNYFDTERSKLENTRYFKNVKEYIFEGLSTEQDAKLFIKRFNTTSAFASLDEQTKIKVNSELSDGINANGGNVVSKLMYSLYIVDKV